MYHTLAISIILLLFFAIDPGEGRNVLVQTEDKQTETEKVALDLESKTPGRIRSRNKALAAGPRTTSTTNDEFFCYECYWPEEHNPILQYTNKEHNKFWASHTVAHFDTKGCICTSPDDYENQSRGYNQIVTMHGMENCYDCDGGENGPGHPGLWICQICCPCPGNPQRTKRGYTRTGWLNPGGAVCKSNNSMMMYYTNDGGQNTMDGRGHTMKSCKDHHRNQKGYDNQWGVNAE